MKSKLLNASLIPGSKAPRHPLPIHKKEEKGYIRVNFDLLLRLLYTKVHISTFGTPSFPLQPKPRPTEQYSVLRLTFRPQAIYVPTEPLPGRLFYKERESPSLRIFNAAFKSLSIIIPQCGLMQTYVLSLSLSSELRCPHFEQILLDGKKRSTF